MKIRVNLWIQTSFGEPQTLEPINLKKRINELLRVKRPQIVDLFADSDILQRHVQ